jgi:hypothetical protein
MEGLRIEILKQIGYFLSKIFALAIACVNAMNWSCDVR